MAWLLLPGLHASSPRTARGLRSARRRVGRLLVASLLAPALAVVPPPVQAGEGGDEPPLLLPARASLLVDGALVLSGELVPKVDDIGTVRYGLLLGGPGVGWIVNAVFRVVHDTEEDGIIDGRFTFRNLGIAPRDIVFRLDIDGCPTIIDEAVTGGVVQLTVTFDEGGGLVQVPFGRRGYDARIDGQRLLSEFSGPFFLQGSGQGIAGTSVDYGTPSPSLPIGSITESFGFRCDFEVSGGEQVELRINQRTGGPGRSFEPCDPPGAAAPGESGEPDMDRLRRMVTGVLANWGAAGDPDLVEDVNGDRRVDALDLLAILGGEATHVPRRRRADEAAEPVPGAGNAADSR